MPEYIDREKLKRDLIDNRCFYPVIVKKAIENAPTADVVPRSEVEKAKQDVLREVFEKLGVYISQEVTIDLKEEAENYRQVIKEFAEIEINRAKQEVAREIFEEFECNISTGIRILKDCINDTDTDQVKRLLLGRLHELCGMEKFIADLKKKHIG